MNYVLPLNIRKTIILMCQELLARNLIKLRNSRFLVRILLEFSMWNSGLSLIVFRNIHKLRSSNYIYKTLLCHNGSFRKHNLLVKYVDDTLVFQRGNGKFLQLSQRRTYNIQVEKDKKILNINHINIPPYIFINEINTYKIFFFIFLFDDFL